MHEVSAIIKKFYGFTPSEKECEAIISAVQKETRKRYCECCKKKTEVIVLDDMCAECFDK